MIDFKIPAENHSRLLVPDYEGIPTAIERNEKRFNQFTGNISGIPLSEFRIRVHQRIAELIRTSNGISQPILMTAHQPGFWHPGILYKIAVAKKFAGKYFLLNVNVDSDVLNPVSCKTPFFKDDRFNFEEIILMQNKEGQIIEKLGKPSKDSMVSFLNTIGERLFTLPDSIAEKCFSRFKKICDEQYEFSENISHWFTNIRRRYFPVPELHELDLSVICNTEEFRLFLWDILSNCQRFHKVYNSCLDRYREEHKIRYKVNPFPNLDIKTDGVVELPLWLVTDAGTRETVFASCGDKIAISAGENIRDRIIGDSESLQKHQIRPKALVLTMFMRLFASSIFVHGVSGGNYDEATDCFIREYYGCQPPEYIVASKTEFLQIGEGEDINVMFKKAKAELRNMQFNPDEYVFEGNPLVAEKRAIVAKSGSNTSKEEFMRLKEIRLTLVKEIQNAISDKENEIKNIEEKITKTEQIRRRDFPYFFYPIKQLED